MAGNRRRFIHCRSDGWRRLAVGVNAKKMMKTKKVNKFPPGLDERRVREIINHYENQTEEEAFRRRTDALRRQKFTEEEIDKILEHEADKLSECGKPKEEDARLLLKPGMSYPIWSPYDSFEAANILLKALRAEEKEGHK